MFFAMPRLKILRNLAPWLVRAAVWFVAAASGCSPRPATADASSAGDVGGDVGSEVAGEGSESADVSTEEVQDSPCADIGDALDAVTDTTVADADGA